MDQFGFDPPELDDAEVARFVSERYGLTGALRRLRGERSHNTLITTGGGDEFVLKVASARDSHDTIDFHARALVHIHTVAPELPVARMVTDVDGDLVPVLERGGDRHLVRLVTFLPGVTFADGQRLSGHALSAIGSLVGGLSAALADFDHPAADQTMPWDVANGYVAHEELWSGLGPDAIEILHPVRRRLELALATARTLPRQVIHNDAHAGNLLRSDVGSDVVTGVIDFGDLVRSARAADLGVSGANLAVSQPDPIGAFAALVAGFEARAPLDDRERAALPELVLLRLALSALFTDYQIGRSPHIAAAVEAERPGILANLARWVALEPERIIEALDARSSTGST